MVFTTCYVLGFAVLLPLGRASVLIGIALFWEACLSLAVILGHETPFSQIQESNVHWTRVLCASNSESQLVC
jgi:hypothetical protein